ncbi:MAG TPA: hypothetical protein VJJ79_02260 [Candidatus Nanoarchaeia archaeon]|nr:hypothetical protein [Candidatus Nanoarchaeia archaeon]
MSSKNTSSDANNVLCWALILGLVILAIKYEKEITKLTTGIENFFFLSFVLLLVFGVPFGIFIWLTVRAVRKQFERPIAASTPTVQTSISQTKKAEPLVQANPAPQENIIQYEMPKRSMIIDTERLLSTNLHVADHLSDEEKDYLQHNWYIAKEFVPFGEHRRQLHYIRERKPESLEHTFVVFTIVNHLRNRGVEKVETFTTQRPDVVFTCDSKEYAIEVETPFFLKKKHRRLLAKAEVNNKTYPKRWCFVVTRSAYKRSFGKYGKVLTRATILDFLEGWLPPE